MIRFKVNNILICGIMNFMIIIWYYNLFRLGCLIILFFEGVYIREIRIFLDVREYFGLCGYYGGWKWGG